MRSAVGVPRGGWEAGANAVGGQSTLLNITPETIIVTEHPPWQAHEMPGYDQWMRGACEGVLSRLGRDASYRQSVLADPRPLHAELFKAFAPKTHPEYAGTYRGTIGTSLEERSVGASQLFADNKTFSFEAPGGLPEKVEGLLREIGRELPGALSATSYVQLLCLAHLFCRWGKLHPFLDGNGHIQRILFAAAAAEIGIPLSTRFTVHPRSYDALLAFPLEMFTRSAPGQGETFRRMVAEYLSNWLGGPFDAPGAGIAPA